MKMKPSIIVLIASVMVGTPVFSQDQSLDELLGIKKADTTKKIDKKIDAKKPKIKLGENVKSKLTQQEASRSFKTVVNEMKNVSHQLNKKSDTSIATQRTQKNIVAKLDQLIYSMRPKKAKPDDKKKKQKKSQQGSGAKPGSKPGSKPGEGQKPGSEFQTAPGSVQQHKPGAIVEQREQWGKLPSRLREELIEGKNEKASPLYRSLAEQYFKALAQESSKQ